ncbi:hypothetical protein B5X24_HaOG206534 [Helicoverpa armigera]|uniref:Uncharacterized protein n=1 Tax=Helicoverpa armigera TaxID=29058 RepID=A0A2W1BPI5_HELAM|nr:hypothetical protein B5X24_HaOG206534 [Helicoverpa armigera]
MSQFCFICNKLLTENKTVVVHRGMPNLIEASVARGDEFTEFLRNEKSVIIHVDCRKSYTRKTSIAVVKRQREEEKASISKISPPRTRTRVSESFCFKNYCLFCGNEANEETEKKKAQHLRKKIYNVTTFNFKESLLKLVKDRSDDVSKAVFARINFEYDLIAAEAKYHDSCYKFFLKPTTGGKIGRPQDESINSAMEKIFQFIETSDDCQFSLDELKNVCQDIALDDRVIKMRLKLKYGSRIIITEKPGTLTFICFIDNYQDTLSQVWSNKKHLNEKDKRFKTLEAAAAIILEDIQSCVFDNTMYPPPGRMFENINNDIPESLSYFLEKVILKNKRHNLDHLKLVCTNISHCIMTAVRPRTFKSKLQLGLSVFFHRRFGSKRLIQIFSSFGLCASYSETMNYESAAVFSRPLHILPPETGTFIQYVADNADINVNTLDGNDTLHIMGIIQIVTPKDSVLQENPLPRVTEVLSAKDFAAKAHVPIQAYQNTGAVGYSKINVQNFDYESESKVTFLKKVDVTWFYGKYKKIDLPGWNGYIECATNKIIDFSKSKISFLPFIHQPANNYDTIYTTLLCAVENAKRYNHEVCIITFDQPLYAKAREIVSAAPEESEVSKIIVRLGGFHLLMSFFGAIGYIMQGSGLKEVLAEVYATKSLEKMLSGHAYARAVRAHTILQLTLALKILKDLAIEDVMDANLIITIESILNNTLSYYDIEEDEEICRKLLDQFNDKLIEYQKRGPTAQLWVQYFRMVSIAKDFIRAERMGDWQAHLNCVKEMLPYFHASGHLPYAKSAHLYLQDMLQLKEVMDPGVYQKFTEGYFTVRRSDKLYCGTPTDMVIEQSLMKSMKTDGGISRGRSTKESVISKWVYGMHAMNTVCEGLEVLANVHMDTTDQHVDASDSRRKKDAKDIKILFDWFLSHEPFPKLNKIVSIASGVVGDDKINCHKAREVGIASMSKMTGKTFNNIKLKRSQKVLPLLAVSSTVKIHEEEVPIDPVLLFQRMSITKDFEDEIENFFEYELAPYPLSLFDAAGMRKTTKSAIYDCFQPVNTEVNFTNATYIIDGGYLLHHVVWDRDETFSVIFDKYVQYLRRHYGHTVTVVFDGYSDSTKNIKASEQRRRTAKISSSSEIIFDEFMTVPGNQHQFFANSNNKSRFISMLSDKLRAANFAVKQAQNDADVLIIETAIEKLNATNTIIVVGEDVDLLVLLTARTPIDKIIYFLKPGRAQKQSEIYSSKSLTAYPKCQNYILFLHAITGCDTSSAMYRRGKTSVFKLFEKEDLTDCAKVFTENDSKPETIIAKGIRFLLAVYGAPKKITCINKYRYLTFVKHTRKNKQVQLSCLPPTSESAIQHLNRVYYQVQTWLGNQLNPEDWGWKLIHNTLEPIKTLLPPAPEKLLNTIFCNCKKDCSVKCGCKKVGSVKMDKLELQSTCFDNIKTLCVNYRKDASTRKTVDYLNKRLSSLDNQWTDFDSRHAMLVLELEDKNINYFNDDVYNRTKEMYLATKTDITNRLVELQEQKQRVQFDLTGTSDDLSVEEADNKLQLLLNKQECNFNAIHRTITKTNKVSISEQWELNDHLSTLKSKWEPIDKLHWEIDFLLKGSNEQYYKMFADVEQKYDELKNKLNSKIWSTAHYQKSAPKIELPEFSGNYVQWISFKDLFLETIHKNPVINNAQKMQHLKTKLRGEAERLVQHLTISAENYKSCWEILTQRYDNRRLQFTAYMNTMLNLPVIQQPDAFNMKKMHDVITECLNGISNIGIDTSSWDPIIVHIMTQKLDSRTMSDYMKELQDHRELQNLQDFLYFIETQFMAYETMKSAKKGNSTGPEKPSTYNVNKQTPVKNTNYRFARSSNFHASFGKCPHCKGSHVLRNCDKFLELEVPKRNDTVSKLQLCKNCLYSHGDQECKSTKTCRECNLKHHTLLHNFERKPTTLPKISKGQYPSTSTQSQTSNHLSNSDTEVLLTTVQLHIRASDGTYVTLRALLDQGSQVNLITENAAQILRLPRKRINVSVTGVGTVSGDCRGQLHLTCKSIHSNYTFETQALIMKKLTNNLPTTTFKKTVWPHLENLKLADPEYNVSRQIDLILGVKSTQISS